MKGHAVLVQFMSQSSCGGVLLADSTLRFVVHSAVFCSFKESYPGYYYLDDVEFILNLSLATSFAKVRRFIRRIAYRTSFL
jgi:hypothetical protein